MIYDKNQFFVKNGKAFAIDDKVECIDNGDFNGLCGVIVSIKTDKDCVFPEHNYEIIVDMFPPENPNVERTLLNSPICESLGCLELADEYDFSSLLKGVVFTNVDSLEHYDTNTKALKPYLCALEVEPLKAYIVTIESDLGENNAENRNSVCYSSVNDAMRAFSRAVALVQAEYKDWLETSENICITVADDRFVATTEKNYLQVTLTVTDVSINPQQQMLLSNDYVLSNHIADVKSKMYEKWHNGEFSDDDYCRLYEKAMPVAEDFEDAFDDNDARAEVFWNIIEDLIDKEVEENE